MKPCLGQCFQQTSYVNLYYRHKACVENCQLLPCGNVTLCGHWGPEWYLGCHGGRCLYCNMDFGVNLEIVLDAECPICLETCPKLLKMRQCMHSFCPPCTRELYHFGEPPIHSPRIITEEERKTFDREDEELAAQDLLDELNGVEIEESPTWTPGHAQTQGCPLCRKRLLPPAWYTPDTIVID